MAYIKLNEVALVETAVEPKILIEENGEIKRISAENIAAPQVQSDWNETDASKASFILNKPESLGSKVIIVTESCGLVLEDGSRATPQYIVDEWNTGSTIRMQHSYNSGAVVFSQNVIKVTYEFASGELYSASLYYTDDCGSVKYISCWK